MTDELLPPDPSKDGWYYLGSEHRSTVPAQFRAGYRRWLIFTRMYSISAEEAFDQDYRLASLHPIPGAAELDALHALPARFDRAAGVCITGSKDRDISRHGSRILVALSGAYRFCANEIRAALGSKP